MSDSSDTKKTEQKKITAQEAAELAVKHYRGVTNDNTSILRVSETELSEDESVWKITLSIANPSDPFALYGGARLDYKTFEINAMTGIVISMKIRPN
ncbi:MAG TPA: hypothetical protein VG895_02135 [Patescibacteria group bacterium]|nr:hypothetical protein [Patescibacteria group bacterium]